LDRHSDLCIVEELSSNGYNLHCAGLRSGFSGYMKIHAWIYSQETFDEEYDPPELQLMTSELFRLNKCVWYCTL
jgi:hypothetical protein